MTCSILTPGIATSPRERVEHERVVGIGAVAIRYHVHQPVRGSETQPELTRPDARMIASRFAGASPRSTPARSARTSARRRLRSSRGGSRPDAVEGPVLTVSVTSTDQPEAVAADPRYRRSYRRPRACSAPWFKDVERLALAQHLPDVLLPTSPPRPHGSSAPPVEEEQARTGKGVGDESYARIPYVVNTRIVS